MQRMSAQNNTNPGPLTPMTRNKAVVNQSVEID